LDGVRHLASCIMHEMGHGFPELDHLLPVFGDSRWEKTQMTGRNSARIAGYH
jgi:hypothetical protein